MVWLSEEIGKSKDNHLCLAFPSRQVSCVKKASVNNIDYFAIPNTSKMAGHMIVPMKDRFEELIDMTSPDVIHIWGTEYQHSLALVNACKKKKVLNRCVVSIQGLVSVYTRYYLGNLSEKEKKSWTLRDIVKNDTLNVQQSHFQKRGEFETECLKSVCHVIGRTDWDKALHRKSTRMPNTTLITKILGMDFMRINGA